MNYIKELNAFREWLLVHDLPGSAVSLWHTLMSINNVARWKSRFNAPNGVVQQLSGLSKSGVDVARKKLEEHGLIKYEAGDKGRAPIYEMVSLVDASLDPFVDPSVDPSVNEPWTIHKHKQNKTKKEEEEDATACALVTTYEENIGELNPLLKEELIKWLDVFSEDVILEAIKIACKHNGSSYSYLEKILIKWQAARIRTVQDIALYLKNKEAPTDNTIPFNKPPHKRSLFDELREEVGG